MDWAIWLVLGYAFVVVSAMTILCLRINASWYRYCLDLIEKFYGDKEARDGR